MSEFGLRSDAVEAAGVIISGWVEPFDTGRPGPGSWHLVIQLVAGDPLLVTADGKMNLFGWLECRVTPVAPYRNEPNAGRLLGEMLGRKIRLGGSWGDLTEAGETRSTLICPIAWILVDRGITPIVEENGFSQVVRDVDLFAFSDDTPLVLGVTPPPHHREDRHIEVAIPFPFRPQANAMPVFAECVDCDDIELILLGIRAVPAPNFPLHADRQHSMTVAADPTGDMLQVSVDTGTPTAGQGIFYAKLSLSYDEAFDKMCDPDRCLTDPNQSCQATGDERLSYVWPQMTSALSGDLLVGPAGGTGLLGRLLGALKGPQFYDHMAIFVEDDGRSIRHCTASDERIAKEAYYTATVTVKTPFGDTSKKLPLAGIRGDVLRYAWPGSISQTLGEICVTGCNRSNSQFSFATLYPEVVANEAANPPRLWQLSPAERVKRTSFHDPEAVGTAKRDHNSGSRDPFALVRLQKDPAFRVDIDPDTGRQVGWIWPMLVKPHPFLAAAAQDSLRTVAAEAKKTSAHYRFFSYSDSTIAVKPALDAPPLGAWGTHAGADWAASTKAAVCSSFVWAAVQAANTRLAAAGKPRIELEGDGEPEDKRPAADPDGLYHYTLDERNDAAKALFSFTHNRVAAEVDKAIADLPGLANTLLDIVPGASGTVDGAKEFLASVVANQLCNAFASDAVTDLSPTWQRPGAGIAVSPDDTMLRWDVRAPLSAAPPPISPAKINVYGNPTPVVIPEPGWRKTPIYHIREVIGKGTLRGTVVRRVVSNQTATAVVGATVRFGCEQSPTAMTPNRAIGFEFVDTKAGRYRLQASLFVLDPLAQVAQEWKSKSEEIELRDGDDLSGIVLELFPPPGLARTVNIRSHHDIVDRVVIGKDRWGHPDMDGKLHLAFDPLDVQAAPPEQQNTKLVDTFDQTTPEVGSGVHVRVTVVGHLNKAIGRDGSESFDGTVVCDVTIIFFDAGEGETNDTLKELNIPLRLGESHSTPYNMVSNDTVPERASGTVTITNLMASLP
ncbi:MAG: hypothetical protein JWO52_1932 [Gammaproteobacteria bacterium]|nr:hypothetical protein [Gammaproteobacteria bacterium]